MIQEAQDAFATLSLAGTTRVTLLFLHPIVQQDISHDGLPIVSSAPFTQAIHNQLNNRWDFTAEGDGTRVEFMIDFAFRSRLLDMMLQANFDLAVTRLMACFEAEAARRYGPPPVRQGAA